MMHAYTSDDIVEVLSLSRSWAPRNGMKVKERNEEREQGGSDDGHPQFLSPDLHSIKMLYVYLC